MKRIISALVGTVLLAVLGACGSVNHTKAPDNQTADAIDAAHNSKNSLDWAGVYTGVTPAADAEGINVQIELDYDETYKVTYQYIGKGDEPFTVTGTFAWNDAGSTIILDSKELPPYYQVGENRLIQLDMEGNPITGAFADAYVLEKMQP